MTPLFCAIVAVVAALYPESAFPAGVIVWLSVCVMWDGLLFWALRGRG